MGEMADLTIEQGMNEDDYYYDHPEELDEVNADVSPNGGKFVVPTCKYCGKSSLIWKKVSDKWFLYESETKVHDCPKRPLSLEKLKLLVPKPTTINQLLPIPSWDESRLSIEEYGCMLTLVGKSRSEDYFTHTSAVAIGTDKRILCIAYNGLKPGVKVPEWMTMEENRPKKSEFYLHAEDNLFSIVKRNECHTLCLNISPCISCCRHIVANNVKKVIFLKEYERCKKFKEFFKFYEQPWEEMVTSSKNRIWQYLSNRNNFMELF